MTDLEDRLRSMLQERAGDIDTVPDRLLTIGVAEITPPTPLQSSPRHRSTRSHRSRAWLLSAAAVAVIALGLTALLAGRGDPKPDPVGTGRPTSTAPSTPTFGAPSTAVSLDWFGIDPVADYSVLMRTSAPTYREVEWQRQGESGTPAGSNGGVRSSVTATVFAENAFPAARAGVLDVTPTDEARGKVYRTEARRVVSGSVDANQSGGRVPTVAWQYRPNSWVVVQALTTDVANAELANLANGVRPTTAVPITLPFRLATAPPGRIVRIVDSRPDYPLVISFADGASVATELQVHSDAEGREDTAGFTARKVGGLPGYIDPANGGYVDYSGGVVTVGKNNGFTLDVAGINRLFDGLTWSGGDGSGAAIPLRSSIGR